MRQGLAGGNRKVDQYGLRSIVIGYGDVGTDNWLPFSSLRRQKQCNSSTLKVGRDPSFVLNTERHSTTVSRSQRIALRYRQAIAVCLPKVVHKERSVIFLLYQFLFTLTLEFDMQRTGSQVITPGPWGMRHVHCFRILWKREVCLESVYSTNILTKSYLVVNSYISSLAVQRCGSLTVILFSWRSGIRPWLS